jgi:hypothetical protein
MIFRCTHFRPREANVVPSEPSERRALRAIEERLLIDDGFVLRYEPDNSSDGLAPGEGASLGFVRRINPGSPCSFASGTPSASRYGDRRGFVWDGETYRSLSHVARAITGVRWNGPRTFGLPGSTRHREARLHERPGVHEVKG